MQTKRIAFITAPIIFACSATVVSAATLSVGPGKTYTTPCRAFAAAKSKDIIEIAGNTTYSGDVCAIYPSNLTIRGINGRPRIDAAGRNALGKGTWVVVGDNVVIDNVEMYGAKVPDANGAALRLEGTHFTLRSSYLHHNENGILSGVKTASNILIEYSEFAFNGGGTGQTHNVYIGNAGSLTFRYNYSHDANVGHNLKSRARVNTITYNRFSSTTGKPSYEIDLPNAGTSYIIGNVIHQPASHSNPNIIAYGEESTSNPGHDLYVVNNTFLNDDSSRGNGVLVGKAVTKKILLQNNIFAGTGTLTNQTGAIEKTNYRALAPGFVDRAGFDLHPTASALVVNAGSTPDKAVSGFSLTPVGQYKHTASSEVRTVSGGLDIGAYEAAAASTLVPTPAPVTWTECATEGGVCVVPGTREVRYGANGVYKTKVATGSVECSNAVFGDPLKKKVKSCSYSSTVR